MHSLIQVLHSSVCRKFWSLADSPRASWSSSHVIHSG